MSINEIEDKFLVLIDFYESNFYSVIYINYLWIYLFVLLICILSIII